jgi:putative ABC transport system permease protein
MFLAQNLLEALESLTSNKLRSGLTMLGIVIGVAAVIAMLSVGQGASASITGAINEIGTNLIFVIPGGQEDVTVTRPLTMGDARAIADPLQAPSVLLVAPMIQSRVDVTVGGQSHSTQLQAVTADYQQVRNVTLSDGEFINDDQVLGRASVVVLGSDVADNLFGTTVGLVGETVRLQGQPFRIIGVEESKGGSGFASQDDHVTIPLTTAQARFTAQRGGAPDRLDMILAQSVTTEAVPQAVTEIEEILRLRHRVQVGKDDFTTFKQQDILQTAAQITGVLTIFLGGIAAISLLVGGIGIMNIMLVSVTERTREIGLRKALGARRRDILIQFLTESATLSLAGGIIGILLGWFMAWAVGQIATATGNDFTPVVGVDSILLATIFSAAVGLFFGIYPASRAASLQPVEALRYE